LLVELSEQIAQLPHLRGTEPGRPIALISAITARAIL